MRGREDGDFEASSRSLGQRIAVARDIAFAFAYPHVLRSWRQSGAEIVPFSPLADEPCRMHGGRCHLSSRVAIRSCMSYAEAQRKSRVSRPVSRDAAKRDVTVYGECGGYMVLGAGIEDAGGQRHPMANLLPLEVSFAAKRLHLGYRTLKLAAGSSLGCAGVRLRMHEFHLTTIVREQGAEPFGTAWDADGNRLGEVGLRRGSVMGSFLHLIDRSDA